jgi:hypothetical protein
MRDRLRAFPELRIFCQNVNRNYGYMDTLLASLYDEYDLLFIQEPPWQRIRSAPSSASCDSEDVIGPPISPNWGVIHRPSGLKEPPRVLVYFNVRIAALRPVFQRNLIDHCDVILFSLGLGAGQRIFANVYSDAQHTAVWILHEDLVALPRLHLMCGDFNIRHASWDPNGPEVCVHADHLMVVCDTLGLTLSSPVEESPTHFPYNEDLTPTVIDLMFVLVEVSLTTEHEIHPDLQGTSDHAPLTVTLPGPDSEVLVTRWSIQSGTDEEQAYLGEVLESLELLLGWEGQTAEEVDEVVGAISTAFSKAWDSQAKETRRGKHSNGWWTQECSDSIAVYHTSRDADDWADYRRIIPPLWRRVPPTFPTTRI